MAEDRVQRAVRWQRALLRHETAVTDAGLVPGRAARRLRYACLTPAGPLVRILVLLAVLGYAGWLALRGAASAAELARPVGFGLLVLLLSTNRASVSEAGLSFDVAGVRKPSSFGFVPLYAVQDVAHGRRPTDWPKGRWHGGPWPGLHRVHVRYQHRDGTDRVRSAWVRRPQQYAGIVLGEQATRSARRRPRRRR